MMLKGLNEWLSKPLTKEEDIDVKETYSHYVYYVVPVSEGVYHVCFHLSDDKYMDYIKDYSRKIFGAPKKVFTSKVQAERAIIEHMQNTKRRNEEKSKKDEWEKNNPSYRYP